MKWRFVAGGGGIAVLAMLMAHPTIAISGIGSASFDRMNPTLLAAIIVAGIAGSAFIFLVPFVAKDKTNEVIKGFTLTFGCLAVCALIVAAVVAAASEEMTMLDSTKPAGSDSANGCAPPVDAPAGGHGNESKIGCSLPCNAARKGDGDFLRLGQ